jgi:iron only hydrogenase large subunit-like protein/uncharacterized protein YoxC
MSYSLSKAIWVDEEKCVNCHRCINACPVKYCNDASGDHVSVNENLCLACGHCIDACQHDARKLLDDFDLFLEALNKKEKIIAVVAPSIAANFQDRYLELNTYLKKAGVEAVFDVSFGAELTVQSYLEAIKTSRPKMVIAQPCPALVTYIQIYKPELIRYLAPADSPMMHTMKMIRHYYRQYDQYKIAVISPCGAKKREFNEVGLGDYNVTMKALSNHIQKSGINLSQYDKTGYDNPPAERAVLFSTPGGLLRTAERYSGEIRNKARKIEGVEFIYPYLDKLPEMLKNNYAPLLVDCLSCELGCNGGPGTVNRGKSADETEHFVEKRNHEMMKFYKTDRKAGKASHVNRIVRSYWKKGLYDRSYRDLTELYQIKEPSEKELWEIYNRMKKFRDEDLYHCNSCGYDDCRKMAVAIFNGLNKSENCHFYKEAVIEDDIREKEKNHQIINQEVLSISQALDDFHQFISKVAALIDHLANAVDESTAAINQMIQSMMSLNGITNNRKKDINDIKNQIIDFDGDIRNSVSSIRSISANMESILSLIAIINDISEKTKLLSINSSIQAAHAGESGRGFKVVATEIRSLSDRTSVNSKNITQSIQEILLKINDTTRESEKSGLRSEASIKMILDLTESLNEILVGFNEINQGTSHITTVLSSMTGLTAEVKESSLRSLDMLKSIDTSLDHLNQMTQIRK